jgi:hypothetical protein
MAKFTGKGDGVACKTGNLKAVRPRYGNFLLPARPVSTTRAEAPFYKTGGHLFGSASAIFGTQSFV